MGIEANATRECTVHEAAPRLPEEVPTAFRRDPRGALMPPHGTARDGISEASAVHGKGCGDVRAMPDGVREMYAVAMQCIQNGPGHSTGPKPTAPQGFASRGLMLGGLLLCLFASLILLLLPR